MQLSKKLPYASRPALIYQTPFGIFLCEVTACHDLCFTPHFLRLSFSLQHPRLRELLSSPPAFSEHGRSTFLAGQPARQSRLIPLFATRQQPRPGRTNTLLASLLRSVFTCSSTLIGAAHPADIKPRPHRQSLLCRRKLIGSAHRLFRIGFVPVEADW